ncbi:MAG: hypothetical protein JW384_01378 [Nitrosomonadaceae bacterium]|nr:hypothetical protein [Nitrosomonadaceae bacterium]
MEPLSANQWITEIRRRVRDTSSSNNVYSRLEIMDALRDAQRHARNNFWIEGVYTSLASFSGGDIALPSYITRIKAIERTLKADNSTGVPVNNALSWQDVRSYNHWQTPQSNLLSIDGGYAYPWLYRIHYEAQVPIFPVEMTNTTFVNSTAVVIPVVNSQDGYAFQWPVQGWFQIGGEIMSYDGISSTMFQNMRRGEFRSGLATHTMPFGLTQNSATLISPVWPDPDHAIVEYISVKAMQGLMMLRLHDQDLEGQRNVAAMAAEYGKAAAAAQREGNKRHQGWVMRSKRGQR